METCSHRLSHRHGARHKTAFSRIVKQGTRRLRIATLRIATLWSAALVALALSPVAGGSAYAQSVEVTLKAGNESFATIEEAGAVELTVRLSAASATNIEIGYSSVSGTALPTQDFRPLQGTLRFSPGETEKTIRARSVDDGVVELTERFIVSIAVEDGSAATIPESGGSVTITIEDDDGPLIADVEEPEVRIAENAGEAVVALVTDRLHSAVGTLFLVSTTEGTATTGTDFERKVETHEAVAGNLRYPVRIPIIDDGEVEGEERFTVDFTIRNNFGDTAIIERSTVTVIVVDDDKREVRTSATALTIREGAESTYEVWLGSKPTGAVTVSLETTGSDAVEATPPTLTFAPDSWNVRQTVTVSGLPDPEDQRNEQAQIVHRAAGADYGAAGEASIGVRILDADGFQNVPKPWLAHFGRAAAGQVADAVGRRLRTPRRVGLEATLAGRRLDAAAQATAPPGWGAGWRPDERAGLHRQLASPDRLQSGASLALTAADPDGGFAAVWGRAALSRFEGRAADRKLGGDVRNLMLGADWTRGAWTAGMLLSHAQGEGSYRGDSGGDLSAALSGAYPYFGYRASRQLTLWGVAGYGVGGFTLKPDEGTAMRTGMNLAMGAVGLHGLVVEPPAGGGPALAIASDTMVVQTRSRKAQSSSGHGLPAVKANTYRFRLGLEGSWRGLWFPYGALTPRLGLGLRYDFGAAGAGYGLEINGGFAWSHAESGVPADVAGRWLLTRTGGFRERGFAGSLAWDRRPDSNRGVSLALRQSVGVVEMGGVDALLSRGAPPGPAIFGADAAPAPGRLELRLGYGFAAFGGRFASTPEFALALSGGSREYSLGWRLDPARAGPASPAFRLEGTRRERTGSRGPEHGIAFSVSARF